VGQGCLNEDKQIEKFGDDYKRYLETVPRMNFIAGLIRLARLDQRGS
jgi:hypothetical protein